MSTASLVTSLHLRSTQRTRFFESLYSSSPLSTMILSKLVNQVIFLTFFATAGKPFRCTQTAFRTELVPGAFVVEGRAWTAVSNLDTRQLELDGTPFGISTDGLPSECKDSCTPLIDMTKDAQCLADARCLCSDDTGNKVVSCFKCVVGVISDDAQRDQLTKQAQTAMDMVIEQCKSAGHDMSTFDLSSSTQDSQGGAASLTGPSLAIALGAMIGLLHSV
jgi:hypothetical protein